MYLPIQDIFNSLKNNMRKSVIIGLLLLTAGLFGVATTLNIIISHAMAQGYDGNYNQIPPGKIYKQFGPIVNYNVTLEGLVANSTATCLTGDTVLNGGYRINSTSLIGTFVSTPLNFTLIETEPTSTADGWTTEAITAGSPFTVQSIAQCFDNSP